MSEDSSEKRSQFKAELANIVMESLKSAKLSRERFKHLARKLVHKIMTALGDDVVESGRVPEKEFNKIKDFVKKSVQKEDVSKRKSVSSHVSRRDSPGTPPDPPKSDILDLLRKARDGNAD
eukprot:ANDGO_06042.mRNA.1 hypothetical protein